MKRTKWFLGNLASREGREKLKYLKLKGSSTESAPAPDIIFGANADVIDVDF